MVFNYIYLKRCIFLLFVSKNVSSFKRGAQTIPKQCSQGNYQNVIYIL